MAHPSPASSSIRVLAAPSESVEYPTAQHVPEPAQLTPPSAEKVLPGGSGLATTLHAPPVSCSISVWLLFAAVSAAPTAQQPVSLTQATAASERSVRPAGAAGLASRAQVRGVAEGSGVPPSGDEAQAAPAAASASPIAATTARGLRVTPHLHAPGVGAPGDRRPHRRRVSQGRHRSRAAPIPPSRRGTSERLTGEQRSASLRPVPGGSVPGAGTGTRDRRGVGVAAQRRAAETEVVGVPASPGQPTTSSARSRGARARTG